MEEIGASSEEKDLRQLLWLRHGCPISYLYGDDGEMQCNNGVDHKPIDFKRDTAQQIRDKLKPDDAVITKAVSDWLEERKKNETL